jgi:hypothetical protein
LPEGVDAQGNTVSLSTTTDDTGAYYFPTLPAGTYSLREVQPGGYDDGEDTVGSLGGLLENDLFSQNYLEGGASGINYNFGEVAPLS